MMYLTITVKPALDDWIVISYSVRIKAGGRDEGGRGRFRLQVAADVIIEAVAVERSRWSPQSSFFLFGREKLAPYFRRLGYFFLICHTQA